MKLYNKIECDVWIYLTNWIPHLNPESNRFLNNNHATHMVKWNAAQSNAYMVPATRVLRCETLSGKSFASPKSPIFGLKFPSRSILLALISLWTICCSASSCRNARPEAVPRHIAALVGQSKKCLLFKPEIIFSGH